MPVFLHDDLGIRGQSELAIWTGVVAAASGFALAVASPIWGGVADRYGRRPMLVRAMLGGAISVGLMGLAQDPYQLLILRVLQGATSGTVAAATALVATETPRQRVGWALGVLSSGIAMGGALGPLAGGLAAGPFGLRRVFFGGGILLAISVIPVLLMVRESPRASRDVPRRPAMTVLRAAGDDTVRAIYVLLLAQTLVYMGYGAAQQLVVLRMLGLDRARAAALAGIAFGAAGLLQAAAAAGYTRIARRTGYLKLSAGAAVLAAGAYAAAAIAPSPILVVISVALFGLLIGVITPALSSMIGLETPPEVQARVFGFGASATAIGLATGPLLGGAVAATVSVPAALGVASAITILLAVVLYFGGREPVR